LHVGNTVGLANIIVIGWTPIGGRLWYKTLELVVFQEIGNVFSMTKITSFIVPG
jgi:hypothetical protein